MSTGEQLERGQHALQAGDWRGAREAFSAALAIGEDPWASAGLGAALWWLGDFDEATTCLEQAYAAFRAAREPMAAAGIAQRLALNYGAHLLHPQAAAGWLKRAERLIEAHDLEPARGEQQLMHALLAEDPAQSEVHARAAVALGQKAQDVDLELSALCQLGAALTEQGRVREGVTLMDEAMAACIGGEARQVETVALTGCITMVACHRCADFERALAWVRATERFAARYGSPYHFAECRSIYAGLLLATGELARAEEALLSALELARGIPLHELRVLAMLARLRLMQGRIEEAQRLLVGKEGHAFTAPVLAAIALATGELDLARAIVERRLLSLGDAQLEAGELLEILGAVELGSGQCSAAAERGQRLAELGVRGECRILAARGQRLWGRALSNTAPELAREHLDAALSAFLQLGIPYEVARTRRALVDALREQHAELAEREARAALVAFTELGARADADELSALLRELGVRTVRLGASALEALSSREREVLELIAEGLGNPAIAGRLFVSRRTVEHHVSSILQKLGLRSRTEAAAEAIRRGLRGPQRK